MRATTLHQLHLPYWTPTSQQGYLRHAKPPVKQAQPCPKVQAQRVSMINEVPPQLQSASFSDICDRCGRKASKGHAFAFKTRNSTTSAYQSPGSSTETTKCLQCALKHLPMLKRSTIAALVVGSILTGLNQGDFLLSGQWNNALYWKVPLTYCVPFIVASYGALTSNRK
jgi:hypothetical protein